MKYLKKFNENKSDMLYEEISDIDYENRTNIHGKDIKFSPDFRLKLYQVGIKDITSCGPFLNEVYLTYFTNNAGNGYYSTGDRRFQLIISSSPDEWFYIKEYYLKWIKGIKYSDWRQSSHPNDDFKFEKYYKCDTMDGLLSLIKDRYNLINKYGETLNANESRSISQAESYDIESKWDKVKFTQYEINTIISLMPDYLDVSIGGGGWGESYGTSISIGKKGSHFGGKYFIDKLDDEWFIIRKDRFKRDDYWVCDGFDDLTYWIKENI